MILLNVLRMPKHLVSFQTPSMVFTGMPVSSVCGMACSHNHHLLCRQGMMVIVCDILRSIFFEGARLRTQYCMTRNDVTRTENS